MTHWNCDRPSSCACYKQTFKDKSRCPHFSIVEEMPVAEPSPGKEWVGNTLIWDGKTPPGTPGEPDSDRKAYRGLPLTSETPPASAEEAVDDVLAECLEAFDLAAPKATAEERRAVRAILLTAANLWGIGSDRT